MYIPKAFREDDLGCLHALMQAHSFATLITQQQDGAPFATHLPFLLRAEEGRYGTLVSHMARANPQWHDFAADRDALAVFQGPHVYVSPSWYEVHPSVPTWNYATVHAYGRPRIIEDGDELYALLQALVTTYEPPSSRYTLPVEFVHQLMPAIVGFVMPISRLEGKYKLSQNRPAQDQPHVVDALQAQGDALSTGVATLMHERGIGARHD